MLLETLAQDLRLGFRMLRRNRGFTAVAVLTLALGIGATTLIFSLADSILFEAFPYRDADRLATIEVHELKQSGYNGPPEFTIPEFLEFRETNRVFEGVIGVRNGSLLYENGEGAQRVDGAWVTTNTFPFLGVQPVLGRGILPEDELPAAPPVCVISDRFWQEQFERDPKALGAALSFNGEKKTVIGVMPPRFRLADAAIWMPYRLSGGGSQPSRLGTMVRVRPGVTLQAAATDYEALVRRLARKYPSDYPDLRFTITIRTIKDGAVGNFQSVLYTLFGAVTMLLLIACSNVANLLLARATAREREIAIRACIGASRGRLIRQLMVESCILAAAGGLAGCWLAYLGLNAYAAMLPHGVTPNEAVIRLNPAALWFALGVTLITTLLCGLAPALHAVRANASQPLARLARGASGFGQGRLRNALVIFEVAVSIVLLAGAGLMARTLFALTHVELGFNSANLLKANLSLPRGRYQTPQQQIAVFQRMLDRVEGASGVTAAGLTWETPALDGGPLIELDIPGKVHSSNWNAMLNACSDGYLKTMGRPIVRGAMFSRSDVERVRHSAVINETFARAFFGSENPVGQRIHFHFDRWRDAPSDPYFDVVAVVTDAKNRGPREPALPQAFVPYSVFPMPLIGVVIRAGGPPLSLTEGIRRQVWAIDPSVVMSGIRTIEQALSEVAYAAPRFGLVSIGGFAGVGLALVGVGIFSVMAYSVSVRTREIGIRMAIGAERRDILRHVLARGLALIGAGVLLGLAASLALTRLLASQLWGVSAVDPLTLGAVTAVLVVCGLTACWLPARRAARVDPMVALRYE